MSILKRINLKNAMIFSIYYSLFLIKECFAIDFIEIKKLSLYDLYFVVLDTGLFLYDFKTPNCSIIQSFNSTVYKSYSNKIKLYELQQKNNSYIFCLVNEYLFIYDEINNHMISYKLNKLRNNLYYYYDLLPYKLNNNISFILCLNKDTTNLSFYYYNFLVNESISEPKEIVFNNMNIQNQKINCQIISNLSYIKCFYHERFNNSYYLSSISFQINDMSINITDTFNLNIEKTILEIKVAKSLNNNFFICILKEDSSNYDKPFCYINSFSYNNYSLIECYDNNYNNYDKNYKVLYFDETDEFMYIIISIVH